MATKTGATHLHESVHIMSNQFVLGIKNRKIQKEFSFLSY